MRLHFLGTRGSMPTGGEEFAKYGSDTSSYLVETEKSAIFFDAGTGICHSLDVSKKHISIFLSHLHLDHIMGLSFFPMLSKKVNIDIYADYSPREIEAAFNRLFSEPFWPCTLRDYSANIEYKRLLPTVELEDATVYSIEGNHPGGAKIYKVINDKTSISYASDYEHDNDVDKRFVDFVKNSDILIFDGQYTESEYESHKGYGHSTKEKGISLCKEASCNLLFFTHHDPAHTDTFLDSEEDRLQKIYPGLKIARQGEVISL